MSHNGCNFSYGHYQEILRAILQNGYSCCLFGSEVEDSEPIVYLRHDVDIDLISAKRLSEIEFNNGIKATYFIFLASPFYNPFEREPAEAIKYIASLGHEIGVHYDNSITPSDTTKIAETIYKQADTLQKGLDINIKVVSFHRPSKIILESNLTFQNIENVYQEKYFKQIKYLSDSRQVWQEGCPCQIFKKKLYSRLQILFHPVWWTDEGFRAQICLEKFLTRSSLSLDRSLQGNVSVYKSTAARIHKLVIGETND